MKMAAAVLARFLVSILPWSDNWAVMGAMTLLATCLHGSEAAVWALVHRLLHDPPENWSALGYSLSAITSMGTPIWFWSHIGSSWERAKP